MTSLHAGLILLLLALLLLLAARLQRRALGIPRGRVIASDTSRWQRVEKPLFATDLALTGKPDYILQQGKSLIPVEVKTGRTPAQPHQSHLFQLAAYCLLIERTYGKRPPIGILHYPGRDFEVPYTPALEASLLEILADMRRGERLPALPRSHEETNRCRACGYFDLCDQKLT
jgi:CRISPR-associated exonuclease Cas4